MPFYCAVKTSLSVCSLLFHFGFILLEKKKWTDNHNTGISTASVKNQTALRGCPTPWRVLREMEKPKAAVQQRAKVFVGVYTGEWLFSKPSQLIFPIAFWQEGPFRSVRLYLCPQALLAS